MRISIIAKNYKEEKKPLVGLFLARCFLFLPCLPVRRAGSARKSEGPAVLAVACNDTSGPRNEGKTAGTRARWAPAIELASLEFVIHNLVYIWLNAPNLRPEMVAACATVLGGGRAETLPNGAKGGRVGYRESSAWAVGRDVLTLGKAIRPSNRGWVRVFSAVAAGWVGVETMRSASAPEARND